MASNRRGCCSSSPRTGTSPRIACPWRRPRGTRAMRSRVATRVNAHRAAIEACGCEVIPLRKLRRRSLNPLREIGAVIELVGVYRRWRPDIVHQVAMKPVLYGSLAARLAGVRSRRQRARRPRLRLQLAHFAGAACCVPLDQRRLAACAEPARLGGDRPERRRRTPCSRSMGLADEIGCARHPRLGRRPRSAFVRARDPTHRAADRDARFADAVGQG